MQWLHLSRSQQRIMSYYSRQVLRVKDVFGRDYVWAQEWIAWRLVKSYISYEYQFTKLIPMTGFEPAVIATTAAVTAAASSLTTIAVDVFRDTSGSFLERLRGGIDERTRTFIFQAFEEYVENYQYRHCQLKVLGMRRPVNLEEVYTSVRLLDSQNIKNLESIIR